jgi:hypothetical protein
LLKEYIVWFHGCSCCQVANPLLHFHCTVCIMDLPPVENLKSASRTELVILGSAFHLRSIRCYSSGPIIRLAVNRGSCGEVGPIRVVGNKYTNILSKTCTFCANLDKKCTYCYHNYRPCTKVCIRSIVIK